MNYRAEVQILLDDENLEFNEWISRYPIEECSSLILEYRNFMQKYFLENEDYESLQDLHELDKFSDYVENLAIDKLAEKQEKENEAQLMLAKLKELKELFGKTESKEIILSEEMIQDLRKILKYVKSHNLYSEETWKPLLHLI